MRFVNTIDSLYASRWSSFAIGSGGSEGQEYITVNYPLVILLLQCIVVIVIV